jgi:phosphate/sulfate permease
VVLVASKFKLTVVVARLVSIPVSFTVAVSAGVAVAITYTGKSNVIVRTVENGIVVRQIQGLVPDGIAVGIESTLG